MVQEAQTVGSGSGTKLALALAIVALLLGIASLGVAVTKSAGPAPTTRHFTITVGERFIVTGVNSSSGLSAPIDTPPADEEGVTGEYVTFEPDVLVCNVGDTVVLTIKNPRGGDHSFSIEAAPGDFSGTTSSGVIQGRANSANPLGTEASISFTCGKAGVYVFRCMIAYDDANNKCHPDHESIMGHLIVMG